MSLDNIMLIQQGLKQLEDQRISDEILKFKRHNPGDEPPSLTRCRVDSVGDLELRDSIGRLVGFVRGFRK